jgi:hypothetical protein
MGPIYLPKSQFFFFFLANLSAKSDLWGKLYFQISMLNNPIRHLPHLLVFFVAIFSHFVKKKINIFFSVPNFLFLGKSPLKFFY